MWTDTYFTCRSFTDLFGTSRINGQHKSLVSLHIDHDSTTSPDNFELTAAHSTVPFYLKLHVLLSTALKLSIQDGHSSITSKRPGFDLLAPKPRAADPPLSLQFVKTWASRPNSVTVTQCPSCRNGVPGSCHDLPAEDWSDGDESEANPTASPNPPITIIIRVAPL